MEDMNFKTFLEKDCYDGLSLDEACECAILTLIGLEASSKKDIDYKFVSIVK